MLRPVFDWLDSRTGFRAGLSHLLDEPLPPGVGWWFVTGSVLMFLLGVQLLTGSRVGTVTVGIDTVVGIECSIAVI